MKLKLGSAVSAIAFLVSPLVYATQYPIPPETETLIGKINYTYAGSAEDPVKIIKRYDVGHNAIRHANPHLDFARELPVGAPVQIPTRHLLPNLPRQGIVINLPEMRMYYYVPGTQHVNTYPIGIGKVGKTIPITNTSITKKTVNPTWIPPEDIRQFNLDQGVVLPKIMPPGPDNPLGPYAIYMRLPTYLIHSTIFPDSIGRRASFGCIRMYEADIEEFFPTIQGGIPVAIINAPVKTGWQKDKLYIEAHQPLEEHASAYEASLSGMVESVHNTVKDQPAIVDWQLISYIAQDRDGIPHEVGMRLTK